MKLFNQSDRSYSAPKAARCKSASAGVGLQWGENVSHVTDVKLLPKLDRLSRSYLLFVALSTFVVAQVTSVKHQSTRSF